MHEVPLTLELVRRRAEQLGAFTDVVSVQPDGVTRLSWRDVADRAGRLAHVLDKLGARPGARVATFAWNTHRHVELHLGVPCAGRTLHAVNLRLSDEHIAYLVDHAGDEIAFIDASLTEQLAHLKSSLDLRGWVVMEDGGVVHEAFADCPRYEQLLAEAPPRADDDQPPIDEADAAWICSTSGTTGLPKLVVTSHRSVYLHTLGSLMVDSHAVSRREAVMAATPMFHVAALGAPYSCAYSPAKLVLPGRDTSAPALGRLIADEQVTLGMGVPTIWLQLKAAYAAGEHDLSSLRTIQCGGAASPRALIDRYASRGVEYVQSWGMTEMSPCGTSMRPPPAEDAASAPAAGTVGPPSPGVELRLVDETGTALPWDATAIGELESRGPWVIRAYLDPSDDANTERFHDGWLRTGDLARIAPDGSVEIVDRVKDLIKSGGEWISSLDPERALTQHPDVSEAAVVAIPHERWGERPAAFLVAADGHHVDPLEVRHFLDGRVARWWVPETIDVVDAIPRTGVGKYDKRPVRAILAARPSAHNAPT